MIEKTILNYLQRKLNISDVYLETPKTIPNEYVVFTIVDRSRENLIDAVTVRIYSYSTSKLKACMLDELVRNAMYDITDEDEISSSKIGGGSDDYDATLKKYRYQCYFNLKYMED